MLSWKDNWLLAEVCMGSSPTSAWKRNWVRDPLPCWSCRCCTKGWIWGVHAMQATNQSQMSAKNPKKELSSPTKSSNVLQNLFKSVLYLWIVYWIIATKYISTAHKRIENETPEQSLLSKLRTFFISWASSMMLNWLTIFRREKWCILFGNQTPLE